jgi:intein/homing endonuclease
LSLSVTITATDPGDLRRKLSDMLSSMGVSSAATVVKEYVATVDIEKGDAVKKVDPPTEVLEGEVLEPETGEKTWDYATEIKPAVLKVSAKFGREGVLKLLGPFGVSNAQLIPDAKHSAFMASVEDMLSRDTL